MFRLVCLISLVACGSSSSGDGQVDRPDASPPCVDFTTASVGRCVAVGGGNCFNRDPDNSFGVVNAGEQLDMVQGFQGSPMIALAVHAPNIDPESPSIAGRVFDQAGDPIATYFGSPVFRDLGSDIFEFASVFMIISGVPDDYDGASLRAEVSVIDSAAEQRCGELEFVARLAL